MTVTMLLALDSQWFCISLIAFSNETDNIKIKAAGPEPNELPMINALLSM